MSDQAPQFIRTDTFEILSYYQLRQQPELTADFNTNSFPYDGWESIIDEVLSGFFQTPAFSNPYPMVRFYETNPPVHELYEIAYQDGYLIDPVDSKYKRKWSVRIMLEAELEFFNEQRRSDIASQRASRYALETDSLVGQVIREEMTRDEYLDRVNAIKADLPYPPTVEFPA